MCRDCENCELVCSDSVVIIEKEGDDGTRTTLASMERCPVPSLRREKPNKYAVAYKRFCQRTMMNHFADFTPDFERACREAGLQ